MGILYLLVTVIAFVVLRIAFINHGRESCVDAYYWELAANAYREHIGRLPVRIRNKYLLEDEEQAYPPLFGFLLSRFPEDVVRQWGAYIAVLFDIFTILPVIVLLWVLGRLDQAYVTAIVVLICPFLLIYGKQINSRTVGQLFLVTGYAFQVLATATIFPDWGVASLWAGAILMSALVLLTHKMTTQLMIFIWPFWSFALGSMVAAFVLPLGLLLATLIVGRKYMSYQLKAHRDIVRFWNRNWPLLGAHMFKNSPIYGDKSHEFRYLIHHRGLRGVLVHLKKVVSYAPLNLMFLPELFLVPDLPAWLVVWYIGANVMVFATLFVPFLKCFGGGHYYVLNATVPAGLGWAWVMQRPDAMSIALFAFGSILTGYSIYMAWRVIGTMPSSHDENLESIINQLKTEAPSRVAAFPVTAAEAIANRTEHAVLWGGHGYGFDRLEPLYPVLRTRLSDVLRKYSISWLVWDKQYWDEFEPVLKQEGVSISPPVSHGNWCLARLSQDFDYHHPG